MARKIQQRKTRKAIYVFWEGESEEAYSKALRKIFSHEAAITPHREKGTFDTARAYYRGNLAFRNSMSFGFSLTQRLRRQINGIKI